MKRILSAMLMVMGLTGTTYAASLENPGHFHGPGAGLRGGFFKAIIQLDLSDAQKREVALILSKHRDQGRETFANFCEAVGAFREVMNTQGTDEDAIRQAFKPVSAAGEEMAVFMAKVLTELKGILTPEQREIIEERMAAMSEMAHGRRKFAHSFLNKWIELYSQ